MADMKRIAIDSGETRPFQDQSGQLEVVTTDTGAVGRATFNPGWKWSQHVKPIAGTDSCQSAHMGYVITGRMTVQMDDGDLEAARLLLPVLERKVGRILVNGYPTGVEVGHAMVHGGPYPSTSDGRSTSVGTLAIRRFLRPVCYQDLPAALLPAALRDGNPLGLWRRLDGTLGQH